MKKQGTDAKFFATNRKGENHELREELRSPVRDVKRDAVKKVNPIRRINASCFTMCQHRLLQI